MFCRKSLPHLILDTLVRLYRSICRAIDLFLVLPLNEFRDFPGNLSTNALRVRHKADLPDVRFMALYERHPLASLPTQVLLQLRKSRRRLLIGRESGERRTPRRFIPLFEFPSQPLRFRALPSDLFTRSTALFHSRCLDDGVDVVRDFNENRSSVRSNHRVSVCTNFCNQHFVLLQFSVSPLSQPSLPVRRPVARDAIV